MPNAIRCSLSPRVKLMTLRPCTLILFACGLLLSVLYASKSGAAAAPEGELRDATQTIVIDLTEGRSARLTPAPSAAGTDPSVTTFIDLTHDAPPVPVPERDFPKSRTPRTRLVDLSNGVSPPPVEEIEDDMAAEPDNIVITADSIADPYEEENRARFKTHVALHRNVIDPVENAYIDVVPEPMRVGMHNFLTNLETPSVLANDVLQGDGARASATLSRFVVNSTIGMAGVFDVASWIGVPYRDDDFGQTLAAYGVGDYPYLLVPVIGPSNPRDLLGKIVDIFLNPLHYIALPGGIATSLGHAGAHELDKRSMDVGELDELERTAPDSYAVERQMARERRAAEIAGQPVPYYSADK